MTGLPDVIVLAATTEIETAADRLVHEFLDQIADDELVASEDESDNPALPNLTPSSLAGFVAEALRDGCADGEIPEPIEKSIEAVSSALASELVAVVRSIDLTAMDLLDGETVAVAEPVIRVNPPEVLAAVSGMAVPEGRVVLVPVAGYYSSPPMDDDRQDSIFAATRWRGHWICRNILIDLEQAATTLNLGREQSLAAKRPNVAYHPEYGVH